MSTEALSPYTRAWGTGGPTGTFTHSKQFAQRLRGVLSRINARIREAIIERDLFNLQTESLEVNELPEQAYEFDTDRQKVRGFLRWLRNQLDEEFLTVVGEDNNQFIRAAYLQGIRTAYNELQNEGADLVRPDPEDLLNRPIHSTTLRDYTPGPMRTLLVFGMTRPKQFGRSLLRALQRGRTQPI